MTEQITNALKDLNNTLGVYPMYRKQYRNIKDVLESFLKKPIDTVQVCVISKPVNTIRTAPPTLPTNKKSTQPVADLEGLKDEVCNVFSFGGGIAATARQTIDHLHATGRLNTAQQAEEIKALKAAVRDMDISLTTNRPHNRPYDFKTDAQKKHAATIEAAKEG